MFTDKGDIAVTDRDGYFTLAIDPAKDRQLTIVADRYATRVVAIGPTDDDLHVELVPVAGAEIIEVHDKKPEETKPLSYQLTADEIRTIPGAGNDILRAAQILPGVARIPFSFGGIVLRGTSPRDTSIYLDGIEVPIAFHFGGVTSFYPGGMLADLQLTAGGFDASYGRTEGGIVTLTTREPRTDRWRLGGSIGLLDSSIQAEGPLRSGGIIIGLRRSYFDVVVDPFVAADVPLPSYWDFQIKTSFGNPRVDGRISPMIFGSIDRVASNSIGITSSFVRAAAPYLRVWGPLSLRVVPWIGANTLTFSDTTADETFSRPQFPGGVRAELIRDYSWGHVRGGVEASGGYLSRTAVNTGGNGPGGSIDGTSTLSWIDIAMWAETRIQLDGDRFAIKPGLRIENYGLTRETAVDPRLNIHQKLDEHFTFRQAIGRYHQPPTPADVDPIDGNPSLQSSFVDQASLGVDADYRDLFASVTGFYDQGWNMGVEIPRGMPTDPPTPQPQLGGLGPTFQLLLEKQLGFPVLRQNLGRSRSYGLEVLVKRSTPRLFWMLSYTLSKSERTEDPRQRTGWRPFELDQLHNLNLAASTMLENWRIGARVQLVSGNPYSPSDIHGTQIPWGGTLPTFFSIDLRADRRWHRCWGDINFYIDIQNATNYTNIEGRAPTDRGVGDADIKGLPIIPFVGVEFLPLK